MNILYHATFGELIPSIAEKGLIPRFHEVWEDCEWGIYLASCPYLAESYCETAESVPEEWLDDIVVLRINVEGLDLEPDPHQEGDFTNLYKGEIPKEAILNLDEVVNGGNGWNQIIENNEN
jgi:hypothetical protein